MRRRTRTTPTRRPAVLHLDWSQLSHPDQAYLAAHCSRSLAMHRRRHSDSHPGSRITTQIELKKVPMIVQHNNYCSGGSGYDCGLSWGRHRSGTDRQTRLRRVREPPRHLPARHAPRDEQLGWQPVMRWKNRRQFTDTVLPAIRKALVHHRPSISPSKPASLVPWDTAAYSSATTTARKNY